MQIRRRRWLFLLVLIGGIAAFSGLWYATVSNSAGDVPAFGGVYVEGVAGVPARLNPLFASQNDVDKGLVALIFAGLTRLDEQGQPFPDLAETWTVSPDGRVYTFLLRYGLVWQDGVELTADDIVFTYSLLRSPGLRAAPSLSRLLAEATVSRIDARTLTIGLPQPFAPLPAYLTLGILPAHLLRGTPATALFDAPFNQRPVGAGPFKLEALTAERAVLAANPAHHLGQPFVQRLELRFFRDQSLVVAALKAKQLDGALLDGGLSAADRLYLEQRSDLRLSKIATGETMFVYLNLKLPVFQDRRVRQALLYALDRDAIVNDVLGGQALRADSPLPSGSWAFTPSLRRYGFDPVVAGLLLDEAGWRPTGSSGRVKDGRELAFKLVTNSDPVRVTVANEVARRWAAIGVRVTVEASGATALVRDLLEPRSFEAVLFASVADADPDPYPAWHSTQTGAKDANLALLQDDRFDRPLEEARLLHSPLRRKELYAQFQELFAQEAPALPLYVPAALYVQRSSLRGVRVSYLDNPGARFWQAQEWYLRTR